MKYHGGVKREDLDEENLDALDIGFVNLAKHMENMRTFGVPFVVAINRFPSDTEEEIEKVKKLCLDNSARVALSEVYARGGEGGEELGNEILKAIEEEKNTFQFLYDLDLPLIAKIEAVAKKIYGAANVAMEGKTRRKIRRIEKRGFGNLPVCIAKTQYSLSDDDEALGRPEDFTLIVTDVSLSAGAGFVVVYCGDIMTMPGLPKIPSAENIDITEDNKITGLS
jgi:formate--tetrahydrofolate ligase